MSKLEVQTNQTVTVTGYYIYKRGVNGEIPQMTTPKQRALVLNKGDIVPDVNGHDSVYRLVCEKKPIQI